MDEKLKKELPPIVLSYLDYNAAILNKSKLTVNEYGHDLKTFLKYIYMQKNIVDKKESYKSGDVVKYKITVKNLDNHGVENVSVKENKIGAKFLEPEDKNNAEYVVESANLVTIKSIPAKGSVDLYAEYTVTEDDKDTIENEAEILCASSTEKNYKMVNINQRVNLKLPKKLLREHLIQDLQITIKMTLIKLTKKIQKKKF